MIKFSIMKFALLLYFLIIPASAMETDEIISKQLELSGADEIYINEEIDFAELASRYSEDPNYEKGTPVTLVIRTEDGKELLNVTTSEFPYQVSLTGIPYSSATLYLSYTNIIHEDSQTGETDDNGEQTSERSEEIELTRELVFTKE